MLADLPNMAKEQAIAKELGVDPSFVAVVGSTLICGKGNDVDFLCLVPSEDVVTQAGFQSDVEVQYESELHSYRRGETNIIATTSPEFFYTELAIAHAARLVNSRSFDMSNREDRVDFHSEIRAHVQSRKHFCDPTS